MAVQYTMGFIFFRQRLPVLCLSVCLSIARGLTTTTITTTTRSSSSFSCQGQQHWDIRFRRCATMFRSQKVPKLCSWVVLMCCNTRARLKHHNRPAPIHTIFGRKFKICLPLYQYNNRTYILTKMGIIVPICTSVILPFWILNTATV